MPIVAALLVGAASERRAFAHSLITGGQVGASLHEVVGGSQYWTIWTKRDDGESLAALQYDNATPETWFTYPPAYAVHANGVAATSYDTGVGGQYDERVCYVGAYTGKLYQRRTGNGGALLSANPPTKKTFTGHVAAAMGKSGGTKYAYCFATTTQGDLYAWRVNVSNDADNTMTFLNSNISATLPITASSTSDFYWTHVFAVTAASRVWMEQHEAGGDTWDGDNLPDLAGVSECGTMAASEGQYDASNYRIYLLCTKQGTANQYLYIAKATTWNPAIVGGSWDFSWQTDVDLPAGEGNIVNSGYALALRGRPNGAYVHWDAYVLTSQNELFRTHAYNGSGGFTDPLGDLGLDPETTTRFGGLAVSLLSDGTPALQYIGEQSGGIRRLYTRRAETSYPASDLGNWWNHQAAQARSTVVTTAATGNGHVESSIAYWGGKAAAVAIATQGTADSWVDLMWSTTDGDTWGAPVAVPDPNGWDRINDGVVDFDESGTAWITYLGVCDTSCTATPGSAVCPGTSARAYYVTTTNGTTFTAPTRLDVTAADHPWISIEHRPGPDRVRTLWKDTDADGDGDTDVVYFTPAPGGDGVRYLLDGNGGGEVSARAGYIDVGASGSVMVTWGGASDGNDHSDVFVCKIDAATNLCDRGPQTLSGLRSDLRVDVNQMCTQNGTPTCLDNTMGWEMAASATDPNRLYYVFNATEDDGGSGSCALNACIDSTDGDTSCGTTTLSETGDGPDLDCQQEKDIKLSVLTFTPGVGWTASAPVTVGPHNDDADQFSPSVTVHAGNTPTTDLIVVSWYDRGYVCADGTVNRCFRAKRAWSTNGVNFYDELPLDSTTSDSTLLPAPCQIAGSKFWTGDYHTAAGERLHTAQQLTIAPQGSAAGTGDLIDGWISRGYLYW